MKRIRQSATVILLILALMVPLAAPALAALEPVSVTLTATNDTMYVISGRSTSVTVTAAAAPSNFDGRIQWSVLSGGALLQSSVNLNQALDYFPNRSITLTASGTGTGKVVVQAALDGPTQQVAKTIDLYIEADAVGTLSSALSYDSINVGQTSLMIVEATLVSGRAVQNSDLTYGSSNTAVARVDSQGVITGISAGTARITARLGDRETTRQITVVGTAAYPTPSYGPYDDVASLGTNYSMRSIHSKLLALYAATYSTGSTGSAVATPSDNASVTFAIPVTSDAYGYLVDSAGREIYNGDTRSFRVFEEMQLEPRSEGVYTFTATLWDGTNTVSATYSILVQAPVRYIRVAIDGGDNYAFSSVDQSGKTGVKILDDAIGTYGSIRFGAILSGEEVGTLYTSPTMDSAARVGSKTVVRAADVPSLYFSPSRSGSFRISYEAFSGADGRGVSLSSGELIVAVDAASLNVTVNLASTAPYSFSDLPSTGTDSAATLLINAINDAIGRYTWSCVRFDSASASAATVGSLRENAFVRQEIASADVIEYGNIRSLYFVPARTGTFEINYNAYSDSSSKTSLASGKLRIVISNVPTTTADIAYTIAAGQTLSLNEDDFIRFYQSKEGSRYSLGYVVFNDYTGEGSFTHDTSAFTPYNSADYYTRDYTGTRNSSPRYLDSVKFIAPRESGFTAVKFTCYGGTSTDRSNVKDSGVLYIFYTSEDLPAITYEAYNGNSPTFAEKDFIPAYQTATKSTASAPSFTIRLLTVPSYGTIYRNYNTSGSATRLTQGNVVEHTFTVNGTNSRNSVNTLSFTPFTNISATNDSVIYIAYDNDGVQLYSGIIRFKLAADRAIQSESGGYTFSLTDFIVVNDSDPIRTVVFKKPDSGKFYVVQDGKITSVAESTRFYTLSPSEGAYPVGSLRYVPRYGQTGVVPLTYVAYTSSGGSSESVINVTVVDKQNSSNFSDVSGWATNSIDFAYSMNLVGGMGGNPPQYKPSLTMRRQDLILILYRMAGSPIVTGMSPYTDVDRSAYYYDSSVWAYQNNIMEGAISGLTYNPAGDVTRQDFAQILYNYTRAMGGDTTANADLSRYSDLARVSAQTLPGVTWAVTQGYITSTTAGYTLEPQRTATRAEIVTFLHRYLTY